MLRGCLLMALLAAGCDAASSSPPTQPLPDAATPPSPDAATPDALAMPDGAPPQPETTHRVPIAFAGSLQNPCWSPASDRLAFTRFAGGYNGGQSGIAVVARAGGSASVVIDDGAQNVGLPGCWNGTSNKIVYSSDVVDTDEVWIINPDGTGAHRVTHRSGAQAFEPSLSPDGQQVVFESHPQGVSTQGTIWKIRVDGSGLTQLTRSADDREPNWAPAGDRILFQSLRSGNWDIWTMATDGSDLVDVTHSVAEDTDASWSPDGRFIVYSSNEGGLNLAALFVIPAAGGAPVRVTQTNRYEGAPAWSPDGRAIAFESSTGDPDGSAGTEIWIAPAPPL
jgi:TolB protein